MQRATTLQRCASVAFIATSTSITFADPVIFDNSAGEFDWGYYQLMTVFSGTPGLDILLGPGQGDHSSATNVTRVVDPGWTSADPHDYTISGSGSAAIAFSGSVELEHWGDWGWPSHHTYNIPRVYQAGDVVGGDSSFERVVTLTCELLNTQHKYVSYDFWNGATGYLGIELTISGKKHYGWIEVTRYCDQALAWGYESTPETPITIPIPTTGTLSVVMIGGVVAVRRRR